VENVNFEDPKFWEHLEPTHDNYRYIEEFLIHLALCHTIIVDERTGKYNASSPDELALVNAAKFFGAEFVKRDEENNMVIKIQGKERSYRLMNILEFTSTRKRMSVIVEDERGEFTLLTKGADSIIKERLSMQSNLMLEDT
jgi:magnesium-transporting ATPase (P-type)